MKKLYLMIFTMVIVFSVNAKVIYVSPQGSGADGESWATAWQTIRAALDTAKTGDEIWVQQGTYTLANPSEALSFVSGVNVYGGFVGTETSLDARSTDPALTKVARADTCTVEFRILTGITADDAALYDGFTLSNGYNASGAGVLIKSNNTLQNCIVENNVNYAGAESYSSGGGVLMACDEFVPAKMLDCTVRNNKLVVDCTNKVIGGAGVCVTSGSSAAVIDNCLIDGNIIEGQYDDGQISGMGAGLQIYAGEITNSTIINNKVTHTLGKAGLNKLTCAGISIIPQKDVNNVVKVSNCEINNNDSETGRGGAILIDPFWSGDNYKGTYTFESCKIIGNHAQNVGAGCLITTASAQVDGGFTTNFVNCLIANNTSDATGGALFGNSKGITLNMTNCTIVRNYGGNKYGGQVKLNQTGAFYTLTNCLIWGNDFGWIGDREYKSFSQMTVNAGNTTSILSCAIQDGNYINYQDATVADSITLSAENDGDVEGVMYPRFVNPSDSVGMYGDLDGTADWHLSQGSDCIDWGTEVASVNVDIEGTARPIDGSGLGDPYYDIGAYEYNGVPTSAGVLPIDEKVTELNAYTSNHRVYVTLNKASTVEVYSILGRLEKSVQGHEGVNNFTISNTGIYILRVNNLTRKIVIN